MPEPAKRTSQRSGSSSTVKEKGSGVTKETSSLEQPAVGEGETKKPAAKRVSKRSSVAATAVEPAVSSLKSEEASAESGESKPGLASNSFTSVSFF